MDDADLGRANNNCLSNQPAIWGGIELQIRIRKRQRSFIASPGWSCVQRLSAPIGVPLSLDPW